AAILVEAGEQTVRKSFSIRQQVLEGDGVRDWPVVEEQTDGASGGKATLVGAGGINPAPLNAPPFAPRAVAHPVSLVRSQDGELDSCRAQKIESFNVNRSLRQPHTLGIASEAMLEVANSPDDLSVLIASVGQRQDYVVVCL